MSTEWITVDRRRKSKAPKFVCKFCENINLSEFNEFGYCIETIDTDHHISNCEKLKSVVCTHCLEKGHTKKYCDIRKKGLPKCSLYPLQDEVVPLKKDVKKNLVVQVQEEVKVSNPWKEALLKKPEVKKVEKIPDGHVLLSVKKVVVPVEEWPVVGEKKKVEKVVYWKKENKSWAEEEEDW